MYRHRWMWWTAAGETLHGRCAAVAPDPTRLSGMDPDTSAGPPPDSGGASGHRFPATVDDPRTGRRRRLRIVGLLMTLTATALFGAAPSANADVVDHRDMTTCLSGATGTLSFAAT